MTRTGSSFPLVGLLSAVVLMLSGCSEDRSPMVIATPWDHATCQEFTTLLAEAPGDPLPAIRWIRLDPWDDPAHLIEAGRTVDLLLGWPTATLAELDSRGLLDTDEAGPFLCFGPEVPEPVRFSVLDRRTPAIVLDDPRIDPATRDQVASRWNRGEGREGHASLILSASSSPAPDEPLASDPELQGFRVAAIDVRSHPEAQTLLDRFRERWGTEPLVLKTISPIAPAVQTLSAELIGATLIDAETELHRALDIIEQSPEAAIGRALLVEPPPWPPDSIQRLKNDPSRQSMIETLAAALVDDPESRAWLLDSWQRPPRPVDQTVLEALATANEGRLLQSSRVLPWLRAEWTAWARQRYSQIARELAPGTEENAR